MYEKALIVIGATAATLLNAYKPFTDNHLAPALGGGGLGYALFHYWGMLRGWLVRRGYILPAGRGHVDDLHGLEPEGGRVTVDLRKVSEGGKTVWRGD